MNQAWFPFQKAKSYEIPEQVFEQANLAQINTKLGLFAELNHAYIVIDNALYLWDYTHPNPELIGYEEQPNAITAVKLVKPRPGVFVPSITHLLVVATQAEIILIGIAAQAAPGGGKSVSLYSTRMIVPVKGINVNTIEASAKTGRIFFGGKDNDDVWELTYQQEERWFASRCSKINHTAKGLSSALPIAYFKGAAQEYITQMVIDDTRDLLYTLSSRSTIRVFHMKAGNVMDLSLSRSWGNILSNIGHMVARSELLDMKTQIVNLSPITATETARLSLQALTSTGCRIFFSATTGSFYGSSASTAPTSMQVHHVRFPPKTSETQMPAQGGTAGQAIPYQQANPMVDVNSPYLKPTTKGVRYAPGFTIFIMPDAQDRSRDRIFLTAPESGRIKARDATQAASYPETGQWIALGNESQEIGLATPSFAASSGPLGFANELAVQFDQTPTEFVILTPTGVQTFRRRRLVDIFAATKRYGLSGDVEGLEAEVKKFIRFYGRSETAATALAVACGQGSDVTSDLRVASITDPEVIEFAQKTFIEQGGKPMLNENSVLDNNTPAIDNVRPSPRHEGMSLYVSRLVRSVWRAPVLVERLTPQGGLVVLPSVTLSKLQDVQRALNSLQEFLNKNKTNIEGLAGPEALGRVSTKQEEVALQGEHRAMNSLVQLIASMIEGIAFVLVLSDERVEEIVLSLPEQSRLRLRQLTFEGLFCSSEGKELAKELVKAIVNRNIVNGSNVDTVAEALRRRCGSFCSADDVVIFKAQEQVKRASEAGSTSQSGRDFLNESLRLFQKVAGALSMEHLQWAIEQYISMAFYAGAIQLALTVAQESDRANRALSWLRDDCPEDVRHSTSIYCNHQLTSCQDPRKTAYDSRKRCYDLIHAVIQSVDQSSQQAPEMLDGQFTVSAKRRAEAYDVINGSEDEVFQNNLYDWYMSQGWDDRLLEISSPFVVNYLRRSMDKDPAHADLLWRYYTHHNNYLDAASVQLLLAKGSFALDLEARIAYLSRAKTSASIRQTSLLDSRQSRQQLLREISDLLDVANIQGDILQRMRSDPRLSAERRPQVLRHLDGEILTIDELFNQYADQAAYYDICIVIYHIADHRNPADIQNTWQLLIEQTHQETEAAGEPQPYEAVALKVRSLGTRLRLADATFPIPILLPLLERYAFGFQRGVGPSTWVVDLFLDLEVPFESLLPVLETMYYSGEQPFQGKNRRVLAGDLVYLLQRWFADSERKGERIIFGSEENVAGVEEVLASLLRSGDLEANKREETEVLRASIGQKLR